MSELPPDILEQLSIAEHCVRNHGCAWPAWLALSPTGWPDLLVRAAFEIGQQRKELADLRIMQDSYSRLYKQLYG